MGYLRSTRHPWPCLIFLLPFVVGYEVGVVGLGGAEEPSLRTGADVWLRSVLEGHGASQFWILPTALTAFMLLRTAFSWKGRPKDGFGSTPGTASARQAVPSAELPPRLPDRNSGTATALHAERITSHLCRSTCLKCTLRRLQERVVER